MKFIDDQINEFEALDVPETRRQDFGKFWTDVTAQCNSVPLSVHGTTIESPLRSVEIRDLTFDGLDGTRLLLPPEARQHKVPVTVHFHGAGGSRGAPFNFSHWLLLGSAVVSFDYRMQSGLTGSNTGFVAHGPGLDTTLGPIPCVQFDLHEKLRKSIRTELL